MDLISPLLSDPGTPRVTTYTSAGRMELSAETLANWVAKVANLLTSMGLDEGDTVALQAEPGWQPLTVAVGCWRCGIAIADAPLKGGDATDQRDVATADWDEFAAVFTDSLDVASAADAAGVAEIYVLSTDPFGRGVEESGGELPFGINDYSPELRIQPDLYSGPQVEDHALVVLPGGAIGLEELGTLGESLNDGERVVTGPWNNVAELAGALTPLARGGSLVMSTDSSEERLNELAEKEKATAWNLRAPAVELG